MLTSGVIIFFLARVRTSLPHSCPTMTPVHIRADWSRETSRPTTPYDPCGKSVISYQVQAVGQTINAEARARGLDSTGVEEYLAHRELDEQVSVSAKRARTHLDFSFLGSAFPVS
jgi:hypothetical protein